MHQLWNVLLGVASGCLAAWVLLAVTLIVMNRRLSRSDLGQAAGLLPDTVRLVRRLAGDADLSRQVRLRLYLLLAYLLLPVDLIPDFIPVIGLVDDAVIVALVLRSMVRAAGPDPVRRHWPGTESGLQVVLRLASSK